MKGVSSSQNKGVSFLMGGGFYFKRGLKIGVVLFTIILFTIMGTIYKTDSFHQSGYLLWVATFLCARTVHFVCMRGRATPRGTTSCGYKIMERNSSSGSRSHSDSNVRVARNLLENALCVMSPGPGTTIGTGKLASSE